jgi:predicted dehydrogenase
VAGVGIVGAGNISSRYIAGLARFPQLAVVGCADADPERSRAVEAAFGVRSFDTVEALLASPDVDVVVNITTPLAHAEVSLAAIAAGKDVYVEKPLAATLTDARRVLEAASAAGRLVGCAPDTSLGSAVQTARAAIDEGIVGEPIGAACFVPHTHPEEWHPDPRFLFQPGAGPLLDMGPYYVTALVTCLGPIAEVAGMARIGASPRVMSAPNRLVESFEAEVETHTSAAIRFASGVVGTMLMSFDVWHGDFPHIEIYGTLGALRLPSPNDFDGDVSVRLNADAGWRTVAPRIAVSGPPGADAQRLRGIGVADVVAARAGAPQRATGSLAYHVLEVLAAVTESSDDHRFVAIESTIERPRPLDPVDDLALMPWSPRSAA